MHVPLLFPEIARALVTETFGKALARTLGRLELADLDEHLYAARKPLSSMLHSANVDAGQPQALAHHKSGSTLNRHYTVHNSKAAVDKADVKLEIAPSAQHGHLRAS